MRFGSPGVALFIVNPVAGSAELLTAVLPRIEGLLHAAGLQLRVVRTGPQPYPHPDCAQALAESGREAAVVFACGGDGTVHEVVQGLAGTTVPLGVIPLGTANALARNLNIPLDPVVAVATLLGYAPRQIPLGQVTTAAGRRWFVLMAGCGPDGALAARLPAAAKQRLGRIAYYAYALRLFLTTRWPAFQVRYRLWGQDLWSETTAVALLAARVPDLGGLFSGLTPKAHLTQEALHVQMLREPAWLSFPAWFVCAWLGLPNPWLTKTDVAEVEALAGAGGAPVLAQADAEALGPLPMHLRVVPHALSLLMPPDATD